MDADDYFKHYEDSDLVNLIEQYTAEANGYEEQHDQSCQDLWIEIDEMEKELEERKLIENSNSM